MPQSYTPASGIWISAWVRLWLVHVWSFFWKPRPCNLPGSQVAAVHRWKRFRKGKLSLNKIFVKSFKKVLAGRQPLVFAWGLVLCSLSESTWGSCQVGCPVWEWYMRTGTCSWKGKGTCSLIVHLLSMSNSNLHKLPQDCLLHSPILTNFPTKCLESTQALFHVGMMLGSPQGQRKTIGFCPQPTALSARQDIWVWIVQLLQSCRGFKHVQGVDFFVMNLYLWFVAKEVWLCPCSQGAGKGKQGGGAIFSSTSFFSVAFAVFALKGQIYQSVGDALKALSAVLRIKCSSGTHPDFDWTSNKLFDRRLLQRAGRPFELRKILVANSHDLVGSDAINTQTKATAVQSSITKTS